MTDKNDFYEIRSTKITKSIALGFKATFESIILILLFLAGAGLLMSIFSGPPMRFVAGPDIFFLFISIVSFLVGMALLFGVIALQIRNNDLLMDIRDEQRELNKTMRDFIRLVQDGVR
jgi:hypothetical protein